MPSATFDKLNQLKAQLEQCNNETAALLLKRTIAKLESQLQIENPIAKSAPKTEPKASQKKKLKPPTQDKTETEGKAEPQVLAQQQAPKTPQTKSKSRKQQQKQRLLPGNGTHRAWCRIPGIIRVQEAEGEEQSQYFLEVDEHQLPLRVRPRHANLISASLDKPLMVTCYPQINDGKIVAVQFCGTAETTPETSEDWVLIGVWNSEEQRVLVQRDRRCDPKRRILQHSPIVTDECLEKLKGGKLYRFECQREGITVSVVGVEAVESGENASDQAVS